jgi:hypothetical protein
MAAIIKLRRDTAANWASVNPVLASGEPGFETDTDKMKIGDGSTAYNSLPYFGGSPGVGVRTIGFSSISPALGQQGTFVVFPAAGTITGWSMVADAGTATVKVWKVASGTAAPSIADNINTSGVSLSTGTAIISSTVSDFTTTSVAANDIFAFNLTAVASVTKLDFQLQITVS